MRPVHAKLYVLPFTMIVDKKLWECSPSPKLTSKKWFDVKDWLCFWNKWTLSTCVQFEHLTPSLRNTFSFLLHWRRALIRLGTKSYLPIQELVPKLKRNGSQIWSRQKCFHVLYDVCSAICMQVDLKNAHGKFHWAYQLPTAENQKSLLSINFVLSRVIQVSGKTY